MFTTAVENRIKAETGYPSKQLIDELMAGDMTRAMTGLNLHNAARRVEEAESQLRARTRALRDTLDRTITYLDSGRWALINECGIANPLATEIDILAGRLAEARRPLQDALNAAKDLMRNPHHKPAAQKPNNPQPSNPQPSNPEPQKREPTR